MQQELKKLGATKIPENYRACVDKMLLLIENKVTTRAQTERTEGKTNHLTSSTTTCQPEVSDTLTEKLLIIARKTLILTQC